MSSLVEKWTEYRDTRRGSYDFRCRTRYTAVADHLFAFGLNGTHTVVDVGAGSCQFGRYLRERGFEGVYIPVDAVLDGTNLESWAGAPGDFVVAIEVLEHVQNWGPLLATMERNAGFAVVVTVPNPEVVDVLRCDPTHVSVIHPRLFRGLFYAVERHSWFGVENDSLLAWRLNDLG